MSDEFTKEGRPPSLAEGTDPDVPQDPGIPGQKAEEEQGAEWEPSSPARGYPEDADDQARAAEVDNTLPPGAMPPENER